MELLRELDGCMGGVGPVTLPPLEAQLGVTVPVTAVTDHVEDILLAGAHHALTVIVMRTVNIQIVVDIHLHRVALPTQTGHTQREGKKSERVLQSQSCRIHIEYSLLLYSLKVFYLDITLHFY